jgi:chromosomal replication initiation ATPase DnaA
VPHRESSRSQQLARTSIPARVPAFRLAAGPQASSRRGNCAGGTHRPARHSADERDSGSLPCDPDNGQYVAVSSGCGKSHLGAALGYALIENGYRVLFTRTTDLVQRLQVARQNLSLEAAIEKLDKYHLIVLDDLCYVRKDQAETSALFELIAARYERRSLLVTSNQPFGEWTSVFPDAAMTWVRGR